MNRISFNRYFLLLLAPVLLTGFTFIQNSDNTFYGAFENQSLNLFTQKESDLHSIQDQDTTLYLRFDFSPGSKKYIRADTSFSVKPSVEYVYNKKNGEIKEFHYEWTCENPRGQERKAVSASSLAKFIEKFDHLTDLINSKIGENNSNKIPQNKSDDYTELTYSWKTDKLSCELYLIYSDKKATNGIESILPTHRIRCEIIWK